MMEENYKKNLRLLKFKPYGELGAMKGYIEDVEFVAMPHPFNKVFLLTSTYHSARNHSQKEEFVSVDASVEVIAKIMTEHYEFYHPEVSNKSNR